MHLETKEGEGRGSNSNSRVVQHAIETMRNYRRQFNEGIQSKLDSMEEEVRLQKWKYRG